MSYSRVGAVTGANKGIGLAIVRQLALQYPKSAYNNGPLLIYLTARDKSRGEEALKNIHNDAELKKAKALAADGGLTDVKFHELDIDSTDSIRSFASFLKKEHPQGVDFVINNAAIAMTGFDSNIVKKTLQVNYYGTLEATQDFLPLIRDGGRLVNVASMSGHLSKYSPAIRERFLSAKSVPEITKLMEDFKAAVAAGNEKQQGWPSAAYAVSKAGIIGMTRAVAEEEKGRGRGVLVNSCCPGYVKTDMTRGGGAKTPDQGAQTPVMLAIGDIGGKTGLFWQNEKVIEW
ncbi:hypothetical protein H2201_006689 [Coniosporium apollinis]|uniref:Carbonyl reductase n=2 Tax=Coniosporium TaxID=2810619 RepID=A0ABQ9NPG0_9PEZI|nr:hypothetical protein H2201_006689 [Coniosporium apollinis]